MGRRFDDHSYGHLDTQSVTRYNAPSNMTKAMEKLLWFVLVLAPRTQAGDLLTEETIARRRLTKFMVGHKDNQECWERHRMDGFLSPIDAHNHFR